MFSKTGEYAIRVTILIASESKKDRIVGVKEVAEMVGSPEAFTAKILQKLVKKNIIISRKGVNGGFLVEKHNMNKIKMIHILEAVECDDIFKGCALGLKECSELQPCPFHFKYKIIKENFLEVINSTSLNELISGFQSGITFLKT